MVPRNRELKVTRSVISEPSRLVEILSFEFEGRTYRLEERTDFDSNIPLGPPKVFRMRDIDTKEIVIVDFSNAL